MGYKSDPEGKTFKDCKFGSYYFWDTKVFIDPNDNEENWAKTIDIHHLVKDEYFYEMEGNDIDYAKSYLEKKFGIKTEYIVNLVEMYVDQFK